MRDGIGLPEENDPHLGRLLTASATTGWLDWIHGELWLFPDGLLRIPLDLASTLIHSIWPTVDVQQPLHRYFEDELLQSLKQHELWVPRELIESAFLHHGILTDRLRLVLKTGGSVKFLWLPWDETWEPLRLKLLTWLGNNLIID